jgi:acetoin utilization deacetylase AcuC-like enzyme
MHDTGIVADPRSRDHDTGTWHPEQPTRFTAVMNRLEWVGLLRDLRSIDSRRATDDELALVHDRGYIDLVRREVAGGRYELSTGDTAN